METEVRISHGAEAVEGATRAISYSGFGLDVATGECVLASLSTFESHRGYEQRLAAAVTNRRTILGGWMTAAGGLNDLAVSVLHEEVQRVDSKTGFIKVTLDIHGPYGKKDLAQLRLNWKASADFFRALAQLPPEVRAERPLPLPEPSEADPTGAHAANAALWVADPRAGAMLAALDEHARAGTFDGPTALDLMRRVVIAHRVLVSGPAGYGTSFASPLSADDLAHTVSSFLGPPMSHQPVQAGVSAYDFAFDGRGERMSAALGALGIASYIGLGIGFSPGRMIAAELMKKPDVRAIRLVVSNIAGGSTYELWANNQPLGRAEGQLAMALNQGIAHSAYAVLERRVQRGWQVGYPELFT